MEPASQLFEFSPCRIGVLLRQRRIEPLFDQFLLSADIDGALVEHGKDVLRRCDLTAKPRQPHRGIADNKLKERRSARHNCFEIAPLRPQLGDL